MSIPAGLLVQHKGEKFVMLVAFILAACGSLLFALMPVFYVAMLALFFIGTAMAMLQVAINPLLRSSGGKQHFAVYSVAAQLLFWQCCYVITLGLSVLCGQYCRSNCPWSAIECAYS